MVPYKKTIRFRQSWPWWRWVMTGLILLALALSTYLSWHYLAGGSMIGCGGGSSCEQVLSSRWSTVGGVLPVSGLAMGAYLAMLVASLYIGPATETPVRRMAWCAMLVLVGSAAGSAVWFIIVQKWFIGAFCPYCMTTHITGLLLAVLVIWRAHMQFDDESTDDRQITPAPVVPNAAASAAIAAPVQDVSHAVPRRITGNLLTISMAMVGLVTAGILATCQVVITPPAVFRGGQSQENLPAIDPHDSPLVGSPDAIYVVNLLFDYKCPHCQKLHFMLDETIRRYNGKLAFTLCPAPLESKCNPYIPRDVEAYKDSCELAKIGLAVWKANREVFPAFDLWLFSLESGDTWQPRSLDAARAKAVELIGQAKLDAALADPWISKYMQTCIRIYGATVQGSNAVPKMVFGSRWVIPQPEDTDDLVQILQKSLGVPVP